MPNLSPAFHLSRVSKPIKSQTSEYVVTTPVINITVIPGDVSATLSATSSSQQIEINITTRPLPTASTTGMFSLVF